MKGCLRGDPKKRWTAKEALENLQKSWAPEVDRIWEAWQAEIKRNKKPEYVQPQDLDKLGIDDDDNDNDASSDAGSQTSSQSSLLIENDDEVQPNSFDHAARAKNIKAHAKKLLRKKKEEGAVSPLKEDSPTTGSC